MEQNCQICQKEFGRVANDHTTKSHLQDYLSDTI
ncbi:hypothetical protein LCGC14_2054820, partial [marine sediment metagenome]